MIEISSESVSRAVRVSLVKFTGRAEEDFADNVDLRRFGIDSLTSASLVVAIEEQLGRTLPPGSESYLVGLRTVQDLVAAFQTAFELEATAY